jgi:hypothetical protein
MQNNKLLPRLSEEQLEIIVKWSFVPPNNQELRDVWNHVFAVTGSISKRLTSFRLSDKSTLSYNATALASDRRKYLYFATLTRSG